MEFNNSQIWVRTQKVFALLNLRMMVKGVKMTSGWNRIRSLSQEHQKQKRPKEAPRKLQTQKWKIPKSLTLKPIMISTRIQQVLKIKLGISLTDLVNQILIYHINLQTNKIQLKLSVNQVTKSKAQICQYWMIHQTFKIKNQLWFQFLKSHFHPNLGWVATSLKMLLT